MCESGRVCVFKGVNERKRDRMKRSVREKETMWLDILKMCWREKECVLKKVKERNNEREIMKKESVCVCERGRV